MFQLKLKLQAGRQWIGPSEWSTNTRSKGGKSELRLRNGHHQKKYYHLAKQFTKTLIQTVIADFGVLKLSTSFAF